MTDAYPLVWPEGWPRTPADKRVPGRGNFVRGRGQWSGGSGRREWTFAEARDELLAELKRFGALEAVLSSNYPLDRTGTAVERGRAPDDQGIAVYFRRRGRDFAMAHDGWREASSNMRSLALSLDGLRQVERHGGGAMLDRAFQGFVALPRPKSCWEVLGLQPGASPAEIRAAWRARIADVHPDQGGSQAAAAELNAARDAALKEIAA